MTTDLNERQTEVPDDPRVAIERLTLELAGARAAEAALRDERRQLVREVDEVTGRLAIANRDLDELSYSVAHGLRAPARAMAGFAHILLDEHRAELDAEARRLLTVVQDNALEMGISIDTILELLRIARRPLQPSRIDVARLVDQASRRLKRESEPRRAVVEIGELPDAWGDAAMLRLVFAKLLANAIEFTRDRKAPRIRIGGDASGDETHYYVADNGIGFDMRYVQRLFRLFETAHAHAEHTGGGGGLMLVRRVVERHGGRVWAEGAAGCGATFHFTLPQRENLP